MAAEVSPPPAKLVSNQPVSITTAAALSGVRDCIEICIKGDFEHPNLVDAVECSDANGCFCDPNVRPGVSSYLESCVNTDFTECAFRNAEYGTAISIYNVYCGFAGPGSATATPTGGSQLVGQASTSQISSAATAVASNTTPSPPAASSSSSAPAAGTAAATSASYSSSPVDNNNTSGRDHGISRSDLINILVGVLVPVFCLLAGWIFWWGLSRRRRQKHRQRRQQIEAVEKQQQQQQQQQQRSPRATAAVGASDSELDALG